MVSRPVRRHASQREALRAFGLDVVYERAEGSRLWYCDPDERAVWDFLGGYGTTFFGHNHPALVHAAREYLERRGAVQAQASVNGETERLAELLASRLTASFGGSWEILLANTGAEAVEIAARHAGEALVARRNATLDQPFIYLAARRAYHGMTARALALTDDPEHRFGSGPRTDGVRFLDPGDPDALAAVLRDQETPARTPVAAFFMEPLQGEGGIHPLRRDVVRAWSDACDRHRVPLIADEIQCGLGRTGSFFYCEQLGIRPDYVLLGKSLGGGLAKLSAIAISSDRYVPGFALQQCSTFAGDGLSSHIGARALELLDEEHAIAAAAAQGERLSAGLGTLAARYPDVIKEVRGRGLMQGIEWQELAFDRSNVLHDLREYGCLGYALAGYLLRAHGIRVAPALSSGNTTRLEPAYAVPQGAIDRLMAALEDLCILLRRQDSAGLLAPCLGLPPPRTPIHTAPVVRHETPVPAPGARHVAFIGHVIDAEDLALWDGCFERLEAPAADVFLDRIAPVVEPVVSHRETVVSITGERTELSFIGLAVASARFYAALRTPERLALRGLVQRGVDLAAAEGCSVIGLGGYGSIITRNGRDLRSHGLALTTGNGYTVAASLEAMRAASGELGIDWAGARAAIVGATGNIGSVMAELIAAEVASVVLIGRESRRSDLEALAGRILGAVARIAPRSPIGSAVARAELVPPSTPDAAAPLGFYRAVKTRLGPRCPVEIGTDPLLCRGAQLIVGASNQPVSVLFPEHLSNGPVVVGDVSVPSDVDPSVHGERPEALVIRGGAVRVPGNPRWRLPGVPLAPGEMYACMAETVLMGLEGHTTHGSIGRLTPERVRTTMHMAARHGFSSVRSLVEASY